MEEDINFTIQYVGGKNMTHEGYQRQDLINIINHLQAKVNFYKKQFEDYQYHQLMYEELQTKLKMEKTQNIQLQQINTELKDENEKLNEELKNLNDLAYEKGKDGLSSVFLQGQQNLKNGKKAKQFKTGAPNLDTWFMRNLRQNNRMDASRRKYN
jgi:uncharacterized protein with von Willebrand factor type A (vWA) domain